MRTAESQTKFIERLLALPPRERMQEFLAIEDPAVRRQVAKALPAKAYSEILGEAAIDNLNRNVLDRTRRQKPSQAA